MGASRTLARRLDLDLIARIEASGPPKKVTKVKTTKEPREAATYRGARRNERRTIRAAQLAAKRAAQSQAVSL
jgi:hypothetical protein